MNKHIEKEYKILVSEDQFDQLVNMYEPLAFHKQINQYFDSHDKRIQKRHGAMRIRTIADTHLFTLKLHCGEGLMEYECEVASNSIDALASEQIITLLKELDLYTTFESIAYLTTYRAIYESNNAELCFDKSIYNGIIDYEIEYEYKKEHDGYAEFNYILSKIDLSYEKNCISKIQRALQSTKKH